jgi:pimeloyl-ACP methyl ester carboxylesterase
MRVNNYEFKRIVEGNGDDLVLVHGSTSDYRTWEKQIGPFSQRFRVTAYSRRYHWPNEPIAEGEDYSMKQHVEDLQAIIEKSDPPVHLAGHSYGGFICLLLAIRSPRLLKSLVVSEPPVITLFVSNRPQPGELLRLFFSRPGTAWSILKFGAGAIEPATKLIKAGKTDKSIDVFGKATLGKEAYENLSEARMNQVRQNLIEKELTGSGFPGIDKEDLGQVHIPTLLIAGEKSPRLFHHLLDAVDEIMPQTKKYIVPEASHISQEDNPEVYNRIVIEFIEKHTTRLDVM